MTHKRLINKWLSDFIEVIGELSDVNFRFAAFSGLATLNVPVDIFVTLQRRGVIQNTVNQDFYFFTFTHESAEILVKVRPDETLKMDLY